MLAPDHSCIISFVIGAPSHGKVFNMHERRPTPAFKLQMFTVTFLTFSKGGGQLLL